MLRLTCALIGLTSVAVAADVSGAWQFTVKTAQGTSSPIVVLQQKGGDLSGTFTSQVPGELKTVGAVKGNAVEFGFTEEAGGLPIQVRYKGTIEGRTSMEGTATYEGSDYKATWSAARLVAAAKTIDSDGLSGGDERNREREQTDAASQPVQGSAPTPSPGPAHQLFVGIRGAVVAIDRTNGQEVWRTPLTSKGKDFVNVVLQDNALYAATQGEFFCLDRATGHVLWHTKLKGLGRGLVTIAGNQQTVVLGEKMRQEQQEAAGDAGMLMIMTAMM
jgi:hypothetical protein